RRHTRSKRDWSSDVCSSDLADVEAGKWLQAKGAKPAAKPQETSVADEAPEVTATVISYDNYVTILDEETLKAWIAKLEKAPVFEIGRASCREREEIWVGGG